MEDTDEQGHEAAARSQGPEVSDPAEPREGHRKSGPLGEQPGFAAAQVTASAASSELPDDEQPATPQAVEARASARKWLTQIQTASTNGLSGDARHAAGRGLFAVRPALATADLSPAQLPPAGALDDERFPIAMRPLHISIVCSRRS